MTKLSAKTAITSTIVNANKGALLFHAVKPGTPNVSYQATDNQIMTQVFANNAARTAAVPGFIGQYAYQLDLGIVFISNGITAGDWIPLSNKIGFLSSEIDLKATSDNTIRSLDSDLKFFTDEVHLILTTLGGTITTQPTIQAGITGDLDKLIDPVQTIELTALYQRELFSGLLSEKGESSLTASITSAAVGSSTIRGKFLFVGQLIKI